MIFNYSAISTYFENYPAKRGKEEEEEAFLFKIQPDNGGKCFWTKPIVIR